MSAAVFDADADADAGLKRKYVGSMFVFAWFSFVFSGLHLFSLAFVCFRWFLCFRDTGNMLHSLK